MECRYSSEPSPIPARQSAGCAPIERERGSTLPTPDRPLYRFMTRPIPLSPRRSRPSLLLDPTERFLYVISQRGSHAGLGNALHVLAVDEEDGTLTEMPSSPVPITVQSPDARPQGVAAF